MELTPNQRKALDLNRNLVVIAAAGSGKTTVLVKRYVRILLEKPALGVPNVLAITYTEKAAAELKERIFREISRRFAEASGAQQARLFEILNQLTEAQIFTIHGFCSRVLRQFPLAAGVNPDFEILDEVQKTALLERTQRDFFFQYELPEKKEDLRLTALRNFSLLQLRDILNNFYDQRYLLIPLLNRVKTQPPEKVQELNRIAWLEYHRQLLNSLWEDAAFWEALEGLLSGPPAGKSENARQTYQELKEGLETFQESGIDFGKKIAATIRLLTALTRKDGGAFRNVPGGKGAWGEERLALFRELSARAARFTPGVIERHPESEAKFARVYVGLARLAEDFLRRVEQEKRALNVLDFDDLQYFTLHLLKENPAVREQLRRRYAYILVDEFQDTDWLQAEILRLLLTNPKGSLDGDRLFLVGDPQQSIFSFRHAEVGIFQEFAAEIARRGNPELPYREPDEQKEIPSQPKERRGVLHLQENFRSSARLISFFNRCFEPIFRRESDFDVEFQELLPHREEGDSRIELFLLNEPDESHPGDESPQIHRMARLIRELVEESEKTSGEALRWGDMAVLFRSRKHLEEIEVLFRRYEIPYQTYKGVGFFQKTEVRDFYHFLKCLVDPFDDFSLLVLLRSSYLGLSDATLFYLSRMQGAGYWEKLQTLHRFLEGQLALEEAVDKDFAEFLRREGFSLQVSPPERIALAHLLQHAEFWKQLAAQGRFSRVVQSMIDALHLRPFLAAQPDGAQKLANLDKFVQTVVEFETERSPLLADFLDMLRRQIEGELQESEAPLFTEDENKVQLLTYHAAKGKEFPVVFLPFLEQSFNLRGDFFLEKEKGFAFPLHRLITPQAPQPFLYRFLQQRYRERIIAEEKRLFYVAATRAQRHLFLLASLSEKKALTQPGYLTWLLEAFGIEDPLDDFPLERIHPLHIVREETPGKEKTAPTQRKFVPVPAPEYLIPETIRKYQFPPQETPNLPVYSVTQLMLFKQDPPRYFTHFYLNDGKLFPPEATPEWVDEPGGEQWGIAVHRLLENFYLRSPAEDERKIRQILLQLHLTDAAEEEALTGRLQELLAQIRRSDWYSRLSGTERHSEFALDRRVGRFVLRGVFDLLFRNPQGLWEVVDYKTNRVDVAELPDVAAKYLFQVQAYAFLLEGLHPEQKIYPVSLFFLDPLQEVRWEFTRESLKGIREEILQLLQALFRAEQKLYFPETD